MSKKIDARFADLIKEQKKELKENIQTTVPHLNGLAKKLEELASSDLIHKKLEDLL